MERREYESKRCSAGRHRGGETDAEGKRSGERGSERIQERREREGRKRVGQQGDLKKRWR